MKMTTLGRSGLSVSELCLGTMTWGTQNTEDEGHGQIDFALDQGINFIDTAEMYPVNPVSADTIGRTEEIIGTWFARTKRRSEVVLATKITGEGQSAIRAGAALTGAILREAVEESLRRLQTDHIDLYQIHWPNRGSYHFRKIWSFDPSGQDRARTIAHMRDMLETCKALVAEGKLRHFGLSNESAWGTAQWLRLAEDHDLPRVEAVQNEYSLLCRQYDSDMAELGVNEDVTLLAYSPLACGLLTGKYSGDVIPEGSRRDRNPELGGRVTPRVWGAVSAYLGIATRHGVDPAQMALAWLRTRPFPIVPIIGATNIEQLRTSISSARVEITDEMQAEIAAAHKEHPMPY